MRLGKKRSPAETARPETPTASQRGRSTWTRKSGRAVNNGPPTTALSSRSSSLYRCCAGYGAAAGRRDKLS